MDKVDAGPFHEPGFGDIIDLERDIWRDPRWLDWRLAVRGVSDGGGGNSGLGVPDPTCYCQQCYGDEEAKLHLLDASNRGVREVIAHLNGPDASSTPNVNDFERVIIWKNGMSQPSIEQHPEYMVLEIESVLFEFVVWQQRFGFPMVAVAMLVDELED